MNEGHKFISLGYLVLPSLNKVLLTDSDKVRGHAPTNCIHINGGSKIMSKLPSFLVTNACHVTNKVDELASVIELNNADITIVTESWLSDCIPSSVVNIGKSFNIYRKDRPTPGGGILAYVHNSIPTKRLCHLETNDMEVLWLIHNPTRMRRPYSCIVTAGIYFPPSKSANEAKEFTEYITKCLDSILKERPSAAIVVTGDFNHLNPSQICQRFNLRKTVLAPTRGSNTLDQLLTNMSKLYNKVQHLPPLGRSDHQCVLFTPLNQESQSKATTRSVRNLHPENIRALGLALNLENWADVYDANDVDDKVQCFNEIIGNMLDTYTPAKGVRMHPNDKEWMTPYIKTQIRARQKAFTNGDKYEYRKLCAKVANLITNAKQRYYENKASSIRFSNPRKWFKCIYSLCGAEKQPSSTPTHTTQMELESTANKLLDAFIAPWANRVPNSLAAKVAEVEIIDHEPLLPSIGQVKTILKFLNPKKATGVDGVPAWVLKRFHEELAPSIHEIICASILQCKYPSPYKHALISPVPKVNNPEDLSSDFRQISILPQVAKVLEKIQLKLNQADLKIKTNQHAFTRGRSTVSALTSMTQDWYDATDKGSPYDGVHALFIDFRKAFDLVDHEILLTKLGSMGVNKSFWLWCQSFLTNRTQQVKFLDVLSRVETVPAGVPQGAVISPTLFNIYINDMEDCIPNELPTTTCKYADDCSQYEPVSTGPNSKMQEVVNFLEDWATQNKMELNTGKTKDMWIGFTRSSPAPPSISIGNEMIERVTKFKLLGVTMQNDLKWKSHVQDIVTEGK